MPPHDPFSADRSRPELPPPEPLEGRRPRILAHVLRAFPMHFAGAERMLHGILEGLVERGWDAHVVAVEHRGDPYEWNGITVQSLVDAHMGGPYAWCDVAVTHLDVTSHAMAWARYGRPLLHICHNHRQLLHHRVPDDGRNFPIFNSEWIAEEWAHWTGPSIVCRPPLVPAEHETTVRGRQKLRTAALMNLLGIKGGDLLWRLARRLPDWRFVGVKGAYGEQRVADPMPSNGEVVPNGGDTRAIWARTSVYLQPSWYESFGMAVCEALCSGIPAVVSRTDGLVESTTSPEHGPCALVCDYGDDDQWHDALVRLRDPAEWERWSRLARLRAAELGAQTVIDLDRLDRFCRGLVVANQQTSTSVRP